MIVVIIVALLVISFITAPIALAISILSPVSKALFEPKKKPRKHV